MKGSIGFARLNNAFMSLIIGVGVTLFVLMTMQAMPQYIGIQVFTPLAVLQSVALSFVAGYTLGDLVPVMSLAQNLVRVLRVRNKMGVQLIKATTLGTCMGFMITCVVSFINNITTHGITGVLDFIVQFAPGICLVAAIMANIMMLPATKLSVAISGFDPR